MCLFGGTPQPPELPTPKEVKVAKAPEKTAKTVKLGQKRSIKATSASGSRRRRGGTSSLRIPLDQGGGSNLNYG